VQQVCEISEILALNVCPNCGYLLDGLPREGNCPECGRTYGQTQVVLYGYGRGKHENSGTAKPSRLAWVLFVSTLVILFQQFWLVVNLGRRGIVILAIIALLPSAYLFIRRRSGSHPRPVQVRLDAKGVFNTMSWRGHLRYVICLGHMNMRSPWPASSCAS